MVRISLLLLLCAAVAAAQLRIGTSSVPVATQYQSYSTALTAAGGIPPYTWSVVSSTGVSLPEGMSLNPATGVVSAAQVNGQGGYAVTVQVADNGSPSASIATATLNFGVNSDSSFGGCQMFPVDSIYNQRADQLPLDTVLSHQIPASYLGSPLTAGFGHGFYPSPGGIPFLRVPANQATTNVNLTGGGPIDPAGIYKWPFPAWPNAVVQGTADGLAGGDNHILVLESSVNNVSGPQTGPCTLYETYQSNAVPDMFDAAGNTWFLAAGAHYLLNSNQTAASPSALDSGGQDSTGIPMVPLLMRYSDVPLGAQHPLRMTFPSPTDSFVWPATGCCGSSGPPEGLLYRLKASVNWAAVCPASSNPQAATVLQALQQYGAYMSDHGTAGSIGGVPDVRWDDNDLACIQEFPLSNLEVVDNSALEVSAISGQTKPYVVPAVLPNGATSAAYTATILAVGGTAATRQWSISSGALPPGLLLAASTGIISGTLSSAEGSPFSFGITAKDTTSGYSSQPRTFSIGVTSSGIPVPDLTINQTHTGTYAPGQAGDTYAITVGNIGTGPTIGTLTVTEIAPAAFTLVSMAGTGWTCPAGANTCTRADALAAGASYPVTTVTVNVAANAPSSVINTATVSGGGESNTLNDTSTVSSAPLGITTSSAPVATQYQSYSTALAAIGGTPPYTWSVISSTGVGLPEGMSLNPGTGVVSATQVNGQGGYAVTVQVIDSGSPTTSFATATVNFGVNSDSSYGGCQMFPLDSIYNQRVDQLPVDTAPSHQIPSGYLGSPIHPDFGHGFYPIPGGIPFMRVPANQATTNVNLAGDGQIDAAGTNAWPFPAWPNAVVEGTDYGQDGNDHHILILESSVNNVSGPQTGACTLYETYQSSAVPGMFDAGSDTWFLAAGVHYVLDSNEIAASTSTLDNGAQDSPGIPMVPLLLRYSEVPLGAQHPLRITFPSPTNSWVWPGTGCCGSSGPPQGLLYRLKASVNWQAACPVSTYPQAATLLQALQQYGAYMSDHGSPGFVQGVPDVRWDDNDLACIKQFHVSDLEVVDNSALEVSAVSGQTKPYVVPAALPNGALGAAYSATISAVGGTPAARHWLVSSGALPPGLSLAASTGTIGGTLGSSAGSPFSFGITVKDTASGYSSPSQVFSIAVTGTGSAMFLTSLTNSASGAGGAIAPGELVTIKGGMLGPATGVSFTTNPVATMLGGTQVSFGGLAAPIVYASATQINAIVPWEVAGQSQVNLLVQYAGASATIPAVPVANAAPGVFTFDSTGVGQAVAANQDYSYNGPTNPAEAGSYVTVYFTGGGVTNPPGVTGSVSGTVLRYLTQFPSVTATVGGVPATVTFAGAAPGLVDGVCQLNIQLSASTPAGNALPLVIAVGGQRSTAAATLSVR
jgi:uncharacterized protein (TIGR03437 family)